MRLSKLPFSQSSRIRICSFKTKPEKAKTLLFFEILILSLLKTFYMLQEMVDIWLFYVFLCVFLRRTSRSQENRK